MADLEELEKDIFETEAKAEGLRDALLESRVSDLTELVVKGGKLKGHLKGLTPAQFKKVIGRAPSPGIITVAKGETQRKVPYEWSIDQLMSERGFKDIEVFKDAIEKANKDKAEIDRLWRDRDILISDLNDLMQKTPELQATSFKITRDSPVFEGTKSEAIVTEMNGVSVMERRQHPFWRVDVDLDGDGKVDHSFRIRYARDAHKLVRATKKQLERELAAKRKPRKFKRRQPKLRVRRQFPTAKAITRVRR